MTEWAELQDLLAVERPSDQPQALVAGEVRNWSDWRRRVARWYARLEHAPGERWAVYHSDAFECAAILFALWARGRIATLPGSGQPVIVERLNERVSGFIGEFSHADAERLLSPPADDAAPELSALRLEPQALVLEIFTSGSSGEPQAIPKQLCQLSAEVNNLEALWGELARDAVTVATVSHQHIYGLLFRVLWPLAAGRCFDSRVCDYLEALNRHPRGWDDLILVSSPSHLSRIPGATDWNGLRRRCRAIFSSGAPLPRAASIQSAELLGQVPIEVFGSSETGGIAWRQSGDEQPWQPVPGVRVRSDDEDGCLVLQSPYLPSADQGRWLRCSDRIELLADGRFQLRGRVDRIAKVEGKRVSLEEMEQRLCTHPAVEAARVVVIEGRRTELGAAVVLTQAAREGLQAEDGRRLLTRELSAHLLAQFERPVLPRRWRYPAALPVNSQGKITRDDLLGLFANTRQGRPLLPEIIEREVGEESAILQLRIPPDLFYFQGHFPVAAVLPGVVQVHWARHFGRELFGFDGEFSHLEAVKFQHVVRSSQELTLELKHQAASGKLSFRYHSAAGQHSSGRIVLRASEQGSPHE